MSVIVAGLSVLAVIYIIARVAALIKEEKKSIDEGNPYIVFDGNSNDDNENNVRLPSNWYVNIVKPLIDHVLSFVALVVLSPVLILIMFAIWIDDPGPVYFSQKRVGRYGRFFMLHKFRTMKLYAPHDVPTHLIKDVEKYTTGIGGFLRKTSLDEIIQIWDIFRGKMSIIGPRPALWNQDDLVIEREKYHANSVMPGLTGLAQIKGRDELEIPVKAGFDGDYVRAMNSGGCKAMIFDLNIFFKSFLSVIRREGVVEGGTGAIEKEKKRNEGE